MRYERIPGPQSAVATALFRELSRFIPEQHLSFGGGTVLAARWQHRDSLDVDLFCEPSTYARLTPATRSQIEKATHGIAGCATARTWCEDIATYTEIEGIEATVLPRTIVIEPTTPSRLEHTRLALQSTAQTSMQKSRGGCTKEAKSQSATRTTSPAPGYTIHTRSRRPERKRVSVC